MYLINAFSVLDWLIANVLEVLRLEAFRLVLSFATIERLDYVG
mgnify:CR=1 FL=1|jgi:hypothetical protein